MAAFSLTPITGLYVLALSAAGARVDVVTRIDFGSPAAGRPQAGGGGRIAPRIKLNQQQKDAVDAVAPGLPAKRSPLPAQSQASGLGSALRGQRRAGDFPRPPNPS